MSFIGRTAVVTGGAVGIGAAIAIRLAKEGAQVVVADTDDNAGRALAEAIAGTFVRLDVSEEAGWEGLEAQLVQDFGGLDMLVNNAGINPGPAQFEDLGLAQWRRVVAVNLDGAFLGCRMGVRLMKGREGAAIVNIGSAAGVRAVGEMAPYCASKAAVHMLTRSVAAYCGRQGLGIRCNAVLPGSVETPMVAQLRAATGDAAAARARTAAMHPIGFVGAPDDISGAALWLLGAEARFVTGALFAVDGGLTL